MADTRPVLSVAVMALNEEQNIGRFLHSVFVALEGLDAEVVLVDSGSTDGTVKVASQYPIHIYQVREDWPKGTGPVIYTAVCKSSGKYIHYIDADVEVAPDWFKTAIDYLDAHPGVSAVAGQWTHLGQTGGLVDRLQTDMEKLDKVTRKVTGGPHLFRSEVLREINFNPYLPGGIEIDLAIRLQAKGHIIERLPKPMLVHHDHQTNPWRFLVKACKRYGRGMGYGMRYALYNPGLWRTYACALRRELRMLGWLLSVPASLLLWVLFRTAVPVWMVLLAGIAAFAWPMFRSRSIQEGAFRRARDIFWSFGFLWGFFRRPQPVSAFPDDALRIK